MQHRPVQEVAAGRWRGILLAMGMDDRALTGKHGPCPMCGGKDRFRFDDKDGRGTFYCSGCGAGDGMALAMGLTGHSFREVAQRIESLAVAVSSSATRPERSDDDKRGALRRVWKESRPLQRNDEAHRYLTGRGLRMYDLPAALRLHPGLAYHGEQEGVYPALLALVTGPDGKNLSIHRTYLKDAHKAPVAAPRKLMQGLPISGAAIRLAPVSQVLGIAEGIETALAASELFEVPVWACISAHGVESFEPTPGVREVLIFGDHDTSYTGQSAAYLAAKRLRLKGLEVEVHLPDPVGDWLDVLQARKAIAPPAPR